MSAFVRRAILGLAALATCAVVYFHVRAADAARRAESVEYYERRISDLDLEIERAKLDVDYGNTVIERTAARRKVDELERERRQLRDAIHRVKYSE